MTERKARNSVVNADGEILLYGVIGDLWDGLEAKSVIEGIKRLGDVEKLTIRINSGGGFITEGLAIFNYLDSHKAKKVVMIDGLAASMASVIAMVGDEIVMPENALMMIHDPWNIVVGNADDMRKEADVLDKMKDSLVTIYAKRTGKDADEIAAMMTAETWLTGAEALEQGFATKTTAKIEAAALLRPRLDHLKLKNAPEILRAKRDTAASAVLVAARAAPKGADIPAESPQERGTDMSEKPSVSAASTPAENVDLDAVRAEAAKAERERIEAIRNAVRNVKLDDAFADELIKAGLTVDQANAKIIDKLAEKQEREQPATNNKITVVADERQKWVAGAQAWLIRKAGVASLVEQKGEKVEPGEFRGLTMLDLARDALERAGVKTRGMSKMELVGTALTYRNAITQSTSDFPILLENTMHKILLAAYATTPDTWSRFCAVGSVSDFRPHNRYRLGTFSRLDKVDENGEFKNKAIPDAEKAAIAADTFGNIINLSRQAIINDDMDAFSRLATMLGRAARLSIEIDVYALLKSNNGLGPVMGDGKTLFHADHGNIGTASALSVEGIDGDRVVMAQQKDPSGNEFLDLRPAVLVVPIAIGGTARVINDAQYDPDTSGKLQRPNKVRGLFRDIVDTPRLEGTRRYLFADPAIAPVIEVAFLDGQQEPYLENREGWRVDGVEWKVRHDYGIAAIDFRGAVTNAGASE